MRRANRYHNFNQESRIPQGISWSDKHRQYSARRHHPKRKMNILNSTTANSLTADEFRQVENLAARTPISAQNRRVRLKKSDALCFTLTYNKLYFIQSIRDISFTANSYTLNVLISVISQKM